LVLLGVLPLLELDRSNLPSEGSFTLVSSIPVPRPFDEENETIAYNGSTNSVLTKLIEIAGIPLPKKINKPTLVQTLIDHFKSKYEDSLALILTLPDIKTQLGEVAAEIIYYIAEINGAGAALDKLKADFE
jgi:hypothetical protein